MEISNDSTYFSDILIGWYNENKRELPWRETKDPYKIWISEIILQQTRVAQGTDYYLRFVARFPNVTELANADEDEVLKYWQGLGYYSRARNLHKAAKQIMERFRGEFPCSHSDVLQLSGIGDYTAAAICSLAFDQPHAVVDGNVYRVLSRLFGINTPIDSTNGKKEFAEIAGLILSEKRPGDHNQAIMEFGALRCVPASPDCTNCPLQDVCKAYELKMVAELPVKSKKTRVTNRYFNYLFFDYQGNTYLQKRTGKDIWQNLYEFPLIESDHLLAPEEIPVDENFMNLMQKSEGFELIKISNPMKHVLSHRVIYAQFITVSIKQLPHGFTKFQEVKKPEIDNFAVSRLMELFLEKIDR